MLVSLSRDTSRTCGHAADVAVCPVSASLLLMLRRACLHALSRQHPPLP